MQRNLRAEGAYAAAWQQWCATFDAGKKRELEQIMDSLQPQIATSPNDPRWAVFIDGLPGYRAFWENWATAIIHQIEKIRDAG